jgi:putative acetyltransferase
MSEVTVIRARGAAEIAEIRALFLEYAESLNFDLCFQGFDEEIDTLPGRYAPDSGELLLAMVGDAFAGGVGARSLGGGICEMKRLYVRPAFRGLGIGRILAQAIIDWARTAGYEVMRLDTIDTMVAAHALYRDLGFRRIDSYYENPLDGVSYFELALQPARSAV